VKEQEATKEDLVSLIYVSVAAQDLKESEVARLLLTARSRNVVAGLTGMLVYQDRHFLQVLEGPRTAVEAVFNKIAEDPRHTRVSKLVVEPIEVRSFGDWTMGYSQATPQFLKGIPGANDFFRIASCLQEIGTGRAKEILSVFKHGSYRLAG
jgi:hypothetical protein